MNLSEKVVLAALSAVVDPEIGRPITELDMVDNIDITEENLAVKIVLTIVGCPAAEKIESEVRSALDGIVGDRKLALAIGVMDPGKRKKLVARLRSEKNSDGGLAKKTLTRVIAVSSGKGGVGKSSLTVNLAAATAARGFNVGILDVDVFGFSIPGLLGIEGVKPTRIDDMILPPVAADMKVLSIGMFLEKNQSIAWRGPLLHRTVEQFLTEAYFGEIDFLFLDLPPGTGDVAISAGQLLPQAEVIVVTTPQKSAAEVAWRSGDVARKTGQRILGVIENMSSATQQDGSILDIFGSGGGQTAADFLETSLLGRVPLSSELRESGDLGIPLVISQPGAAASQAILEIANLVVLRKDSISGKKLPIV